MKPSSQPEGLSRAPKGLGRLKTALSAGVLALAGSVGDAVAGTRYDLPLEEVAANGDAKLNKLVDPSVVQISYPGSDSSGHTIDFTATREENSVILTQISGIGQTDLEGVVRRELISDGVGCQNEIRAGVPDEFGLLNTTFNGVPVWMQGCDQEVRGTFSTKGGKLGLLTFGPFGTAGNAYMRNYNGVLFDFDPNSNDWCADYNAMIAGQNPLNNGVSDRVLSTRMEDYVVVDGAIRIVWRGPTDDSGVMPAGTRYAAQDGTDTGPYRYFQSYDNGDTYVLDQQVSGGNPVPANDFTGVDLTGAQRLRNVVLTYGSVDGLPGGLPGFDAHEKVVTVTHNADGTDTTTVTLVRRPVVIREGFLDPAQRDMDGDGTPDHQDAIPGANTPGGDLNRFSDAICHLTNPENQIGNGTYGCEFKAGVVPPEGTNTVMATPEGSRVFTDGNVSVNLQNGVMTVGNVSADAENPSIIRVDHAHDVSSGLDAAALPNIVVNSVPGKSVVVDVEYISNIGLDNQPHPLRVVANAADLLNDVPLVIPEPTGDIDAHFEFVDGANAVFSPEASIINLKIHTEDVAQAPDAAIDAGTALADARVDAGVSADAAGVVDMGVDAELDAGTAALDSAVDAELDANVIIVPPQLDAAVLPEDLGAALADARVDAAVLLEDAAVQPVDAAPIPVDAAPMPVDQAVLPADAAPLPPDAPAPATLPVDASIQPADAAVQTPDIAAQQIDAGAVLADARVDVDSNCEITGEEVCDGDDNDCDGQIDEEVPQIEALNEPDPCAPGQMLKKRCIDGEMVTMSPNCERDANVMQPIPDEGVDPVAKVDAGLTARADANAPAENGGGAAGGCSTVPGQNGLNGLPFIFAAGVLVARRQGNRRNDPTRTDGRRFTDTPKA